MGLVNITGFVAGAEWIWIIGIIVIVVVIISVIRSATKRKRIPSSVSSPSDRVPQLKTQDNTQFWVCPNCGNNTQMKGERQYCPSCKIYLSI